MRILEENSVTNNSEENREELSRLRTIFTKFLRLQDSILRQKARIKWLEKGDSNTAYFHNIIKDRRKKPNNQKIMDDHDNWLEGNDNITEGAVRYYQKLFTHDLTNTYFGPINLLRRCITDEDNDKLISPPTMLQLKESVFSIYPDSSPGPDGLSGHFYQSTWNIIVADLHTTVSAFFSCDILPKFYTHTCLVLIPKVDHPQSFSDLRPISLCRSITKNILLAQEIISDIGKPNRGRNVVMKLDMTKAYDRISWTFLCLALRKLGFSENWVDIIYNLLSNNCKNSIQLIIDTLSWYEKILGQLINKNKRSFSLKSKVILSVINRTKRYMECPLITGKKKLTYYSDIVNKVTSKVRGWHTKFLSTGGRATLIRHVFMAITTHILSAINPPKGTLELIEKIIARFFWFGNEAGGKHHWIAWDTLSYPYNEGGANFRKISDICRAFKSKQWWNLRTTTSLWGDYMKSKYLHTHHPVKAKWISGNSQGGKAICEARSNVENHISWKTSRGEIDFWFDNWSSLGPLYLLQPDIEGNILIKLNTVYNNSVWNWNSIQGDLSEDVKNKITSLGISLDNNVDDTTIWRESNNDLFALHSAWNIIRNKRSSNIATNNEEEVWKSKYRGDVGLAQATWLKQQPYYMALNGVRIKVSQMPGGKLILCSWHCFREANKPAEKLASLSHGAEVRGLINMDRWEFPSFRMKPVKPSYLVYEPP
ncbi:hypothetical protein KY290_013646 [Solanum tuberosum]|uniref:Reverse transcriptase domain-containing protein n=1 Tax=Solanum tuberosum TaxID=4113 RepID=A0ABQ7VPE8_SOLTU|nr:hypothetical protein KY290_013646 [Solanum tuberosum]